MARIVLGCLLVFAIANVESVCGARELTESEYLALFHEGHPARVVLDEATGRARAGVSTAGLLDNPVGGFEREAPGEVGQNTWSLQWKPPLDGQRSARKAAAEAHLRAVVDERALGEAALRATLREAYAAWALASERAAVLDQHAARLRQLVTRTWHRARSGEASALSARRMTLAVVELESESARASGESRRAAALAQGWLVAVVSDVSPVRPLLPSADAGFDPADARSVVARRSQAEAAAAEAKASGRFIEFPELMFGWQTITGEQVEASGPVMGVSWPIPIFARQQGDRQAAQASLAAAEARLELESARAIARVAAATQSYEQLRTTALAAVDSVRMGESVLTSAEARFEMGEGDVTELLETVRGVLSARLAVLDLYDAALAAHRELELVMGRSWPKEGE